jgi:hypothetical protein
VAADIALAHPDIREADYRLTVSFAENVRRISNALGKAVAA